MRTHLSDHFLEFGMAKKKKFTVADLRGLALYLRARADGTKRHKRAQLIDYAKAVSWAADTLEARDGV